MLGKRACGKGTNEIHPRRVFLVRWPDDLFSLNKLWQTAVNHLDPEARISLLDNR
jgi:hypothetical protein